MLTDSAIRLLRRLLGAPHRSAGPYAGTATVLDGNTAVAVTEAGISEAAGLGAGFPADAAVLTWRAEQQRHGSNLAGAPLSSLTAEGPRGALAAAMGLAMSGVRASTFLSGPDLAACQDLLHATAGQRLPLVIHVTARGLAGGGQGTGTAHEAVHLAADCGAIVLIAANVQEAVDLSLIARRTAELTLTPALVFMDAEQTALSVQDVCLPEPALVEGFLGNPSDPIPAPTPAQQLLFGETRRRVPLRHDPDHPVLLGGRESPLTQALGKAAGSVFFDAQVPAILDAAFAELSRQTGRACTPVSGHQAGGAALTLVAVGSAIETAELTADWLRRHERLQVGVIGLRCLRPFPRERLQRLLADNARICVLERHAVPLNGDPPLLRELRAALDRAARQGTAGEQQKPGPVGDRGPELLSVIYGLGGLPLKAADLAALCRGADGIAGPLVYLGLSFTPPSSPYPKRQILLDRLRRTYPEAASLGLTAIETAAAPRPDGTLTLALSRPQGAAGQGLAAETAAQLHAMLGGGLRTKPGAATLAWGEPRMDLVHLGPDGIRDPGDAPRIDLLLSTLAPASARLTEDLIDGGTLLIQTGLPDELLWEQLDQDARSAVRERGCRLFRVAPPEVPSIATEHLLGALCSVLVDSGRLDATHRRLLSVREDLLRTTADSARRLEGFQAALGTVRHIDPNTLVGGPSPHAVTADDEAPALVRRLGRIDDHYDSLPRFWDQVGVLYHNGDTSELSPDPYLALGTVPPLSAGFRDLSRLHNALPVLDPTLCTGCGECWSGCPDGALSAALLTPSRLIEAGITATGADALRPLTSKLAAGLAKQCRDTSSRPGDAGGPLAAAYDEIKDRLPFPDDRKAAIAAGIEAVSTAIDSIPLVAAAPFFAEPQAAGRDGELLALSLDPSACKGCGICARVCVPAAMTIQAPDTESLHQACLASRAFERLPATPLESIQRARTHPEVGTTAATLLSSSIARPISGGDGAEPGSGAGIVLRASLGLTAFHRSQTHSGYLSAVQTATEGLTGLIRGLLADALPADDLDTLAHALETNSDTEANLNSLIETAKDNAGSGLDTRRLGRLVDLARRLDTLGRRLTEGREQLGRAAMGLVLTDGDFAAFPYNPFPVPVVLDPAGDGAQLAAGLLEGQLRQAVSDLVLLRKAELELSHPEDAVRLGAELEGLTWRKLDAAEHTRCPALWLVGDAGSLGGRGLAQLTSLLASDLPVKILLLADLDLGLAGPVQTEARPAPIPDAAGDLALLSLSRRGAYVAQSSIGFAEHLTDSVEQALAHPGPALLHVHAPRPTRHGFDASATIERSRAAVTARVFPLFRYDPGREGVFGTRIDLDANPDPLQPLAEDQEVGPRTLADWALGELRFAELFTPLDAKDPAQVPFGDYLALEPAGRNGKIPFVERADNGSAPRRLRVDKRLVSAADERQQAWRMLQELAGLVTPFTERVQREAEERVATEHQANLAALAADYEARITALRAELGEETRHALHERLMQLAGYGGSASSASRVN